MLHDLDYTNLQENLSFLDDWEERYSYILELGKKLPDAPDNLHNPHNIVKGCVSQVWLLPKYQGEQLFFYADSDSHLVKGLIAIILIIYNGLTKSEIVAIDFKVYFQALGLAEHLTPQRSNGVFAMIQKIQEYAQK